MHLTAYLNQDAYINVDNSIVMQIDVFEFVDDHGFVAIIKDGQVFEPSERHGKAI